MKKVIRKCFWAWNFDKEEKWLNEMAAKGLALTSVSFCRYEFEDCAPGEYKICLEFLEHKFRDAENAKYIEFLEETGAEHVGSFLRWAYFRKRGEEGEFKLFSDHASRIKHLTRIIAFIALLVGLNFYLGCYNLFLYFFWHHAISLIGILNLLVAVFGGIGLIRLLRKRKKLKNEQQIFE